MEKKSIQNKKKIQREYRADEMIKHPNPEALKRFKQTDSFQAYMCKPKENKKHE